MRTTLAILAVLTLILAGRGLGRRKEIPARDRDISEAKALLPAVPPSRRVVTYTFTLENTTDQPVRDAKLWAFAPRRRTSTTDGFRARASHLFELVEDDLGNRFFLFRWSSFPPHATEIVTISAVLTPDDGTASSTRSEFLAPGRFVESAHPEIVATVREIENRSGPVNPADLLQWMRRNIGTREYSREPRGALAALRSRQGDCTEHMFLFTALCRAVGIPARGIGGFVLEGGGILRANEYHNWVEVYTGSKWKGVDPQRSIENVRHGSYLAMQVFSDTVESPLEPFERFRLIGDGLRVSMN